MAFLRIIILAIAFLLPLQLSAQKSYLIFACKTGNYDAVNLFLQQKGNADLTDGRGVTLLMYASECDNDSVCELLLSYGANPNAMANVNGFVPPITNTVIQNNPRMLDLMLQFGGDPNLFDNANFLTPIHYAVRDGYLECADVLLFHGAHPNKVCRKKNPLQISAYYGDTLMAELLLKHGGNINAKPSKISPLCIAVQRNDTATAAWLIRHGADVNEECRLGAPIVYSALYADEKMSELLCANGADINSLSVGGKNGATLSLMSGNRKNQQYFESHGGSKANKLILGSISASYCHEFCNNEYRMGFRMGIHESHYNIGLSAAYLYRPHSRFSVLTKEDGEFVKSHFHLSVAQVGIEKRFSFRHQCLPDFGGYVGCNGSFCSAKSDYLELEVTDDKVMLTPFVGLYQRFLSIGISAGYKYYPMQDFVDSPNHVAEIALSAYFNTNRRGLGKFKMY